MSVAKKISQLTPATSVATNDYTVLVDGSTSANKRATVAQIMAIAGGGTVTSVNASGTQGVTVSGGPVTSSGSLSVGLGAITPASVAASGTVTGFNLSGTNTGDQTIQLLGDVEAAGGTGNLTTVIATGAVTNSKLANMTGPTVKGRTSGTGTPSDVTMAQLNGMLPTFVPDSGTGGTTGLVPAPGAGDAAQKKFLRADGAWAKTDLNDILPTQTGNAGKVLSTTGTTTQWLAAPGVGTVTSVNVAGDGNITASGGPVTAAGTISVALSNTAVTPATYGSASAVPVLSIDEKGRITSASTASLGTLATQNASSVTLSGGTINGTAIGATTPTTGVFTALTVNDNSTLGSSNTDTVNFNARVASDINPSTDDTFDLGVTGHEWRNLNIDGTANIDSLVADTADVNGGTIDATAIGATTPSTGAFTTLSATGAVTFDGISFADGTPSNTLVTTSGGNVGIQNSAPNAFLTIGVGSGLGSDPTYASSLQIRQSNNTVEAAGLEFLGSTFGAGYAFKWSAIDSSGVHLTLSSRENSATWSEKLRVTTSGNVLIGTTTNSSNGILQLTSHTTSAGGIGFGTDVTLYRSAANTLKTDDNLVVAGALSSTGAFTSGAAISANFANARIEWFDTSAGTDAKRWDILSGGGVQSFRLVNDANSAANTWLQCNRTGFASATITITGATSVTGALSSTGILSGPGFRASKVTASSGLVKIQDEGANVYNVIGSRNNADSAALPLVFQGSNFDFLGAVAVTGALSSTGALAIGNTVNTVSPTSPNRTVTIVIGGTTYYLHAKTTND
jgi:hypothetical protein